MFIVMNFSTFRSLPDREGKVYDQNFDSDFWGIVGIRKFRRDVQSKIVIVRYNVVTNFHTQLTSVLKELSCENRIEGWLEFKADVFYQTRSSESHAALDHS